MRRAGESTKATRARGSATTPTYPVTSWLGSDQKVGRSDSRMYVRSTARPVASARGMPPWR